MRERRPLTLRQRALLEWRGSLPSDPGRETARPLSQTLPGVFRSLGLEERVDGEEVSQIWREVVGPFLAQHSSPASFRRGTLRIRVLQPAVRHTLEHLLRLEIEEKLRARLGADRLQQVRFTLG
ncbi:MAG: DUF721 domain-containing protein [Verrucomicrobiota bacterium]